MNEHAIFGDFGSTYPYREILASLAMTDTDVHKHRGQSSPRATRDTAGCAASRVKQSYSRPAGAPCSPLLPHSLPPPPCSGEKENFNNTPRTPVTRSSPTSRAPRRQREARELAGSPLPRSRASPPRVLARLTRRASERA